MLLAIPLGVVLLVGSAWFFARPPARWMAAKVYGHRQAEQLVLRAQVFAFDGGRVQTVEVPLRLSLRSTAPGAVTLVREAEASSDGVAAFDVFQGRELSGRLQLRLERRDAPEVLGEGELAAFDERRCDDGPCRVQQRGGVIEGQATGDVEIRVGVLHGVLAVPFEAPLELRVSQHGEPLPRARIGMRAAGGVFSANDGQLQMLSSDPHGVVRSSLLPREHLVELTVMALPEDSSEALTPALLDSLTPPAGVARWYGRLPVVPGASYATVDAGQLVVSSPVPRSRLYVDFFDDGRAVAASSVPLQPRAASWSGRLELPPMLRSLERAHALVSSEPDMQAMALVGWPLGNSVQATFERRMELLVDGVALGQRRRAETSLEVRRGVVALVLLAALLEVLLFWGFGRRLAALTPAHLAGAMLPQRRAWAWGVTALLLLGLTGLAALLLW